MSGKIEQWFYARGSERIGPLTGKDLREQIRSSAVTRDTVVWHAGLPAWVPAGQAEELENEWSDVPPPLPSSVGAVTRPELACPAIRPWVRWLARQTDYTIGGLIFGLGLGFLGLAEQLNDGLMGMLAVLLWLPVEAVLLSTWGSTPGKWLLCTDVRTRDGEILSGDQSLKRAVRVWLVGVGIGFPLFALITSWFQYDKLKKNGATTYDRDIDLRITHQWVGVERKILLVIVWLAFFSLIALGASEA